MSITELNNKKLQSAYEVLQHHGRLQNMLAIATGKGSLNSDEIKTLSLMDKEATKDEPADLTPKEREVFNLIFQGLSNREIGSNMTRPIQESTVEKHVSSILRKAQCYDQKALIFMSRINPTD